MTDNCELHYEKRDSLLFQDQDKVHHVAARGLGIRHVQTAIMALASFMVYSLRSALSIAIVAMVKYKHNETSTAAIELAPTYEWDEKTQGLVLSSFFWGYFMMQLPAGVITERFGGHRFLCLAVLGSSVLTLLLPPCAYIGGWRFVCFNRMLQGLTQGFAYPSIFALLGVWVPPSERGKLSGISLGGYLLGTVATSPVAGYLAANYGWPAIFYCLGAFGTAAGLVVLFFGANSPASHRMISEAEKNYIVHSLGGVKVQRGIPWKKLFTSPPVLALMLTMACYHMVFLTFFTKIPTYLATVLKFKMEDNGVLSALPYFVAWLLSFVFSYACDILTGRGWLKLSTARKVFNSIGLFGSAICVVLMSHAKTGAMSVFLLVGFMSIQSAIFPGMQANFVDVAPNFSGTIFSIANFVSAFLGIIGPIGVGFIVTEAGSVEQWRIVLYLSAAILSLSNLVFVIWSTAETQPWNWPEESEAAMNGSEGEKKKDAKIELSL